MLAIHFCQGEASLVTAGRPQPGGDDVLIRVLLAGICNTDMELLRGYMAFSGIPGHEFVGIVEQAPSRPDLLGKRVVADINIAPGTGDHRHAPGRKVLGILNQHGAFAHYLVIPADNCHAVPGNISNEAAVFAEPLAAALEVGQQVHIRASDRVAVLGDGKLGILIALGLRHLNPGLTLLGRHPDKLRLAALHGVHTALPGEVSGPFDIVIEATGRPDGITHALDLVRPEGTIVLKTTVAGETALDMARVVVEEITLIGSRCGSVSLALDCLAHGRVDPRGLIQARYPLARFQEAFAEASRPGAGKVLLDME